MNANMPPNTNPDHLPEPLRRAVDAVREQPMPQDAVQRAVDRAARTPMPKSVPWRSGRRRLLALCSMAASLILALGVYTYIKFDSMSVQGKMASNNRAASTSIWRSFERQTDNDNTNIQNINAPGEVDLSKASDHEGRDIIIQGGAKFAGTGSGTGINSGTGSGSGRAIPDPINAPLPPPQDNKLSLPVAKAGDWNKPADLRIDGWRPGEPKDGSPTVRPTQLETVDPQVVEGMIKAFKDKDVKWPPNTPALPPPGDTKPAGSTEKPATGPQVWQRDRTQPTFARVYVGDKNSLELVSLRVTVTIEGPRARTVVDHVFRNPHDRQLEGTFEYPMPSGASPSYFAMFLGAARDTPPPLFVRRDKELPAPQTALARRGPTELVADIDRTDWGRLQEGRIVAKEKAVETYEDVVRGRIDPALLEYAGGNTFRGRVFPIQAKGYNRVILAYEELLPMSRDKLLYQFPLPDCKLSELQFMLSANSKECQNLQFLPKDAKLDESGSQLVYTRTWKNEKPEGPVVFAATPTEPRIQAVTGRQGDNGSHYVYARVRPDLQKIADKKTFAQHAVFLLDTSLSEYPARFDANMKLLRKILECDADIKEFNILTFNVGAAWVDAKGFLPNTAAGREKAFDRLDGLVLEGATDVSAALDRLARNEFDLPKSATVNCFLLSDGQITWGDADVSALTARFEQRCPFACKFNCYHTGLGAENAELFAALTRKGGGVFNCFTEKDLDNAAVAHRNQCLQIQKVRFIDGPEAQDVMIAGRQAAVYPGGDLIVTARMDKPGKTKILVAGTFEGAKFEETYPLEVGDNSELAPRAWAEVAVASLLGLNDPKLDTLVTAYCQQFGIVSRAASFLVLENDNDYKRFNIADERGKTVTGDLAMFLENSWSAMGAAKTAKQAFLDFLGRIETQAKLGNNPNAVNVYKLLLMMGDKDFEIPTTSLDGKLLYKKDVPALYLSERDKDRRDVHPYLTEAKRRASAKDLDGAVRVLSSVIEEHPTRDDALRLVGYRLLDLNQPGQAARLFQQVQRQRPFEPHSYRDLARSLEENGLYGLAAVQYEIVLAGTWHNRFRDSLKLVVLEEYVRMMQEAIRRKAVSADLANHFGERLEHLWKTQPPSDLRVTISWNTDGTDIDLWVIEPDGTKCYYQNKSTKIGGNLSEDQTQGYGPERYVIENAPKGEFKVMVHYFRANPNLLGGETHVNVVVTRNAGRPNETVERHTVILKKQDEAVEVCRVKY